MRYCGLVFAVCLLVGELFGAGVRVQLEEPVVVDEGAKGEGWMLFDEADAGSIFGDLPVVDEIVCAENVGKELFAEEPAGASVVRDVLGRECRVLENEGDGAKYFAYLVGKGKGLEAGRAYLLSVEYPEDRGRMMYVLNRGAETERGMHTGATVGDALDPKYVQSNPESLEIPLSGRWEQWRMLFRLHDRFPGIEQPRGAGPRPMEPADGFWVIFAQSEPNQAPMSAGAAVSRIRLFAVPDAERFDGKYREPEGLPKRRLFWREEMSDGVISSGDMMQRGVMDDTDWYEYKAKLMGFLGVNTFCKDLLEFGHNQGWDSGRGWYNQSRSPRRWANILEMVSGYGYDVLPYYEYCGSVGPGCLGVQKRCVTLGGKKNYTHISWSEKANADITDPATLADAKRLLDYTIVRHKDKVDFVGAWMRPRPSAIPMSFSDRCLGLFAAETKRDAAVTREKLRADEELLGEYYQWWFGKRREFLVALRDHLRGAGVDDAMVFYTTDASESGLSFAQWDPPMVAEDKGAWERIGKDVISLREAIEGEWYAKALSSDRLTWGNWEWQHACPRSDPGNYRDVEGVLMTYTFNRAYTVGSADAMDRFRTESGLAMVRHYCLNEDMLDKKTGYFACDVERAGPYCMLAEVRAVAYGDPWYIGYLTSGSYNRGFPEYVRAFNAAFLSLPAMPSKVVEGACSDGEVVVRKIETDGRGTYFAVANTGYGAKEVEVDLGVRGDVRDAVSGEQIGRGGAVKLRMEPCELRALVIGSQ